MNRKKIFVIVVVSIVVVATIAIYYHFDPTGTPFAPRCIFHDITGLRCPGCGMQRALHAFLQGDITRAVSYNYALVAVVPLTLLYCASALMQHRMVRFYKFICSTPVLVALFVATVAWFVIRNISGV